MPASLPQHILWKASRPCTDVTKVQKLALAVLRQRFLNNEICFISPSVYMGLHVHNQHIISVFDPLTPWESFGLVNIWSKQWSMLAIFIAALNTECIKYILFCTSVLNCIHTENTVAHYQIHWPVEEDTSSNCLIGVGTCSCPPHLLTLQVIKYCLNIINKQCLHNRNMQD